MFMFPSVLFSLFDINMFRISSKMDLKRFYICVMAVFVVPGRTFQGDMSITGNTELRGNITITCSWTLLPNEAFINVVLRSLPVAPNDQYPYCYLFNSGVLWASPGNQSNSRMSPENFNSSNNQAIVRISNVQCSDGQNYSCYFTIGQQGLSNAFYERISSLDVKGAPPVVTIEQSSLHPNKDHIFFYEKSTITAKCAADLGKPGHGQLEWRLYDGDRPIYITKSDSRIQSLERDASRTGNLNCSEFVKQSLVLTSDSALMDFTVACFVNNQQTKNRKRVFCKDTKANLCAVSPHIWTIQRPDVSSMLLGVAIAIVELIAGIVLIIIIMRLLARYRRAKPEPQPPPPPPEEEEPSEGTDIEASTVIEAESFTEEGESSVA